MHHANGKLPPAAAAPNTNHTTPYESSIHNSHGSSNAGDLDNDWGTKPGLVASEKATVVTIEREGTVGITNHILMIPIWDLIAMVTVLTLITDLIMSAVSTLTGHMPCAMILNMLGLKIRRRRTKV